MYFYVYKKIILNIAVCIFLFMEIYWEYFFDFAIDLGSNVTSSCNLIYALNLPFLALVLLFYVGQETPRLYFLYFTHKFAILYYIVKSILLAVVWS